LDEFPELSDQTFVVTEKLHGSCIQLAACPNGTMRIGTRNRFLEPGDNFYDIWNTLDKYERLGQKFQQYVDDIGIPHQLFGEYFGCGIQKGVDYGPGHRIRFFGLMIDGQLQSFKTFHSLMFHMMGHLDDVVPILGLFDSLDEALSFNTEINTRESLPAAPGENLCEGVVLQPYDRVYRNAGGHTFLLKKKNEAFREKAKAKKPRSPDTPEERLNLEFRSYLTDARLQSVFSKHGEIEQPGQIGDYIRLMLADAREDFMKDHVETFNVLSKKEQRCVMNVGSAVAHMLKEYL